MKKNTKKNDPRSAEFYESRHGDVSMWSRDPMPAKVETKGTVMFSVRLGIEELEAVRDEAARRGMTVSDVIRDSLSMALRLRTLSGFSYTTPGSSVAGTVYNQIGGDQQFFHCALPR